MPKKGLRSEKSFIETNKGKLAAGLAGVGIASGVFYEQKSDAAPEVKKNRKSIVEFVSGKPEIPEEIKELNKRFEVKNDQVQPENDEGGFGGLDEVEERKAKLEELEKMAAEYISDWKNEFPNLDFTFENASESFHNDKDIKTALLFRVSKKVNGEDKSFMVELFKRKNGTIDYVVNPADINSDEAVTTGSKKDFYELIKVKSNLFDI